jgi:hypothetical protein
MAEGLSKFRVDMPDGYSVNIEADYVNHVDGALEFFEAEKLIAAFAPGSWAGVVRAVK